jgi:hypothetical protein
VTPVALAQNSSLKTVSAFLTVTFSHVSLTNSHVFTSGAFACEVLTSCHTGPALLCTELLSC